MKLHAVLHQTYIERWKMEFVWIWLRSAENATRWRGA